MGSTHRALLNTTGGGEKLHEAQKNAYKNELNSFLSANGVSDWDRASAIAHFDMGYYDGHSGEVPYYGEDWDRPLGHEAEGA